MVVINLGHGIVSISNIPSGMWLLYYFYYCKFHKIEKNTSVVVEIENISHSCLKKWRRQFLALVTGIV